MDLKNQLENSFERMRARYHRRKKENKTPECACNKCKSTYWELDVTDNQWFCFICGNRGGWENGEFVQYYKK